MTLAPGTHLGPYEIVGRIGAGSMGEVWKARDTRLGREVAVKVLPEAFAADPERLKRFEQEARTVAALSHPNILAIFDVGTHEGSPYLVTELLEGETLRNFISQGPIPVGQGVDLARQIALGLSAAHAKGIVHRDLKPENVFLTSDGVKILDFGLAKQAPAILQGGQSELTTLAVGNGTVEGSILGTVGYMSPEQVRGEGVDARSDLFALGVLLYEMVSGHRAFQGGSPADTLSAILKEDPPDLDILARSTSLGLLVFLRRCLQKRREDRFTSAQEVVAALLALVHPSSRGPEPEGDEKSIVVLPFENLSPDPDNAFFADGLTEELIADLSKVEALKVISRTSAMHFKGTTKQLPEIARTLGVRYVLEGSVRRAGNNLRITAQLIEAATDAHLWAEKYTGTLDDIFELQEQLSRRIVEALKGKLTSEDASRLANHGTRDPRVYESWLRARQACWLMDKEGVERAIRLIAQALEVFGDHALLHAANGIFHWAAYDFGISPTEETLRRGEASATRALEINPDLSHAWLAKGLIRYKQGDMAGNVRCLRRALALERNGDTLFFLAFALADIGRMDEARRCADEAVERDPLTWITPFGRCVVDLFDGRFDTALQGFRRWMDREMGIPAFPWWWLGQALAFAGKEAEAVSAFQEGARSEPGQFTDMCGLGALAFSGEGAKALLWFETSSLPEVAVHDEVYPAFVSTCFARLGELDLALRWLEQAIRWGFVNPRFHGEYNPFLAPLRGDPRFQALMEMAQEQTRAIELE